MRKLLAPSLIAFAGCLTFVPAAGAAVLEIAFEQPAFFPPTGAERTVYLEVFVRDRDHTNEQLSTFALQIEGPQFSPEGVRFGPPVDFAFPEPVNHPFVFGGFPGVRPEDFGSTYNVIRTGAALATSDAEVDVTELRNGLVRIPIIIPADAAAKVYSIVVNPDEPTGFAGRGAPITFVTTPGFITLILPEPAGVGVLGIGFVSLLRRRPGARAVAN